MLLPLLTAGLAAAILAAPSPGGRDHASPAVPRLVFPLVARTALWDNYGDPRGNGRHEGIDLENPWRAPVVAVEAGRVQYATSGLGGCMLYLYGRSGTSYMYIHLNDDLTPRNDGRGGCRQDVAYAVPDGARVAVGEQVAWNGDSGDAAGNPHLHFEVHPHGGAAANPFRHLRRAQRPLFAARPGQPFSLGLRGRLVEASEVAVVLDVERVRHYPGGRWLDVEPRRVELALPTEALAASTELAAGLARLRPKAPVTVFTAKEKATRGAVVGAARALIVGSVSQ
ncbi:MAG TPA: M23 family metallopeptidase [Gaiellaceae bacterium]|nr:M23 family metallopeptidase [Gaiellaceae bacterium]